ncbi:MAG: VOC family protein [Kofleriaceae bacterium]|nr:VOC family protein [Kofleriaceae bacterium]
MIVVSAVLAAACAGSAPPPVCPPGARAAAAEAPGAPADEAAPHAAGLQIKLTTVYVDDQDRALRFYTEVLGFAKKDDVRNGTYRWLTVTAPGDGDGGALQLALNDAPAAKAYQKALFQQGQPAVMFFTDDLAADVALIGAAGAEITLPPTKVTGSTIAMLKDTCGNLVQLTELAR